MEGICPGKQWSLKPSNKAARTVNPIRRIVDYMNIQPNPELELINLSLGDPTLGGILKPHPIATEAVAKCVTSGKANGYNPAFGSLQARKAVAAKFSKPNDIISSDDIVLTSGCSAALDLAITGIANPGENILVPAPGFSIYKTLAESVGIECRSYPLIPDRAWEADLDYMNALIDKNTRAILVNNPSNPCGSVWSSKHIRDIIAIAEQHCLPIIADELYWEIVFSNHEFVSFSSQSEHVPIISCRGLAKVYFVPGWRVGWIQLHDRDGKMNEVRAGLRNLSQRILGPNSIVEKALPMILSEVPESHFREATDYVEQNAEIAFHMLSLVPGLKPVKPEGAMYMMVGINPQCFPQQLSDPVCLTQQLIREKSVYCLPAKCFEASQFIRLVLTSSHDETREACERIAAFCEKYSRFH